MKNDNSMDLSMFFFVYEAGKYFSKHVNPSIWFKGGELVYIARQ